MLHKWCRKYSWLFSKSLLLEWWSCGWKAPSNSNRLDVYKDLLGKEGFLLSFLLYKDFTNTKSLWDRYCLSLFLGVICEGRNPKSFGISYDSEILKFQRAGLICRGQRCWIKLFFIQLNFHMALTEGAALPCHSAVAARHICWMVSVGISTNGGNFFFLDDWFKNKMVCQCANASGGKRNE